MNNIDISTGSFPEDKQIWKNGHRQWSEEELEIIDAHYKNNPKQTAIYLGRTETSCKDKYYQRHRKKRPSTIEIQEMRRMMAKGMSHKAISDATGYTYGQVLNILKPTKR
jgi:hypothetical protein